MNHETYQVVKAHYHALCEAEKFYAGALERHKKEAERHNQLIMEYEALWLNVLGEKTIVEERLKKYESMKLKTGETI